MCYSENCYYEDYRGDCTWTGGHPFPCPDIVEEADALIEETNEDEDTTDCLCS